MYNEARMEKLKEIKRLMQELMAEDGGDTELSESELSEKLDEASEGAEEAMEEGSEMASLGSSEEEDAEEEFKRKRREYFRPETKTAQKSAPSRIVIASNEMEEPRLSKAIPAYKSGKKMRG